MTDRDFDVVTGAFGYTGKYVARRLLAGGRRVHTLTGHPDRPDPFGGQVDVAPLDFHDPAGLARGLQGAATLYNTYWVRFPRGEVTFDRAVENSRVLFRAAGEAGVRRIVHISITNADEASTLPYFRGKGLVERALVESGLSHAIVRPTVVFGAEDILINNIAWLLRRFPVFVVFGSGQHRLQPVFVEDLAEIAVSAGQRSDNLTVDAVGPETFTFNEVVRLVRRAVRSRAVIAHSPPGLGLLLGRLVGRLVGDVVITRDEIDGLMAGLLVSTAPPTGVTPLSRWLAENASTLGTRYASELRRHYTRE
ncbi:MAG: NAD(P)H-binding protein [Chloroflexota bacterium]|nr:NAD(P)H-binding protein [Chloroflexota bacterium]